MRPIVGWHLKPVDIIVNPILDTSYDGVKNLDFSLFKNFSITERAKLQFRAEAFNAFNTPYFGDPNGPGFSTINSIIPDAPRVGEVRSLRNPMRIVQFGLKLSF